MYLKQFVLVKCNIWIDLPAILALVSRDSSGFCLFVCIYFNILSVLKKAN